MPVNMKAIIPYDLRPENPQSDAFYEVLDNVTTQVLKKGSESLDSLLSEFHQHYGKDSRREDILLDFLISGVLWIEYSYRIPPRIKLKNRILLLLYFMRKRPELKDLADIVRGKLATKWLIVNKRSSLTPKNISLRKLELFLSASCEFKEELRRIRKVRRILSKLTSVSAEKDMKLIISFALWFKDYTKSKLGGFTSGVEDFLENHPKKYLGKENYFFCGRKESEYHLNMVGAEIMNRVLEREFNKTGNRIILLPSCMASNENCKASFKNGDLSCCHCTGSCNVSVTSREMEKIGIRTVLIQHSSNFSRWLKPWSGHKHTGIIGVACILNLLTGGFEMRRLGIPSQCVFLDFPACRKHWKTGTRSSINILKAKQFAVKPPLH
jgi:hypothetical protein